MFRIVTFSREYGSGGAAIAAKLAERLNWKIVDRAFLEEVAKIANVRPELAERFDECIDSWFHRVAKNLWRGGYEGVASTTDSPILDAEVMTQLSRRIIEQAANMGECVIVGRGAQCILRGRPDVFHVFVYAPWEQKVERVRTRLGHTEDPEGAIESTDRRRATFIRTNFGCDWTDRRLYDLMISSAHGDDAAADTVLAAIGARAARV